MKFITLFVLLMSWAQAQVIERYCLPNSNAALQTYKELGPILVPRDEVSINGECLIITTSETRMEFLRQYLRLKTTTAGEFDISSTPQPKSCKLEITKRIIEHITQQNIQINPVVPNLNKNYETRERKEVSNFEILSGTPGSLTINREVIAITCTKLNNGSAKLTFSLSVIPRPVVLTIKPVNIEPQKNMQVSSEIIIFPNVETQIASNIKDLQDQATKMDASTGIDMTNSQGSETQDIRVRLSP